MNEERIEEGNSSTQQSEFVRAAYAEAIQAQLAQMAGQIAGGLPQGFSTIRLPGRSGQLSAEGIAEIAGAAIAQQFGHGAFVVPTSEEWTEEKAAPPISEAALREFPVVRVTEEDLAQDGNEVCVICLEQQKVGDKAFKLSCGHLYHRDCVLQWLRKSCICPTCRYEFRSDNTAFERGRMERMRRRKPRIRRRQLESGKISTQELATIYQERSTKHVIQDFTQRQALIQALEDENLVDFINEPKPLSIYSSPQDLERVWSPRDLKDLMLRVGVDSTGCIEKSDLLRHLIASGRIDFLPPSIQNEAQNPAIIALEKFRNEEDTRLPPKYDTDHNFSSESKKRSCPHLSSDEIPNLSVRELKCELRKRGLEHEIRGCIDKDHLRRVLARAL
uniref:RING-type domain-containing protein n=1 Tax=Aureoumbra lagunensis TaxID=44058 RepID=A0A7S3NMT8_9STRA|mmetsp:Transcript_12553/g.16899  ORF Transcript_12553/g.16899 Transcript_12553/m.16899 type:complete len:389 (+) Transcript_12553:60-1226(+)